jgi:folate-binding protein YgfZ
MSGTAPRNYGDPAAEYAAARSAAGLADRPDRCYLRVYGRDPVRMVQGLVTNDVAQASAERAVYAAVLTPKGRMVADVRVFRLGDELLLETDAAALAPLTAHLRRFVPPLFARFEDAPWRAMTLLGPDAAGVLDRATGAELPPAAPADAVRMTRQGEHAVLLATTSYAGVPGVDIICAADGADQIREAVLAAGARPVGGATLEVLRIEAGVPRWGAELDENVIPLEAGLRSRAISETKGCYTGQEVIIRILHRGHVNWLRRGMLLGDVPTPAAGAELHSEAGRRVGRITSAAWSPRHGQAIALGYVRREVTPGSVLALAPPLAGSATVVELPFPPG